MKVCYKCGLEKKDDEFKIDRRSGKPMSFCSDCYSLYYITYRTQNKEKHSAHQKKKFQENKDVILAKQKAFYDKNSNKVKASAKIYREKNSDKIKKTRKDAYEKNREIIAIRAKNHRIKHSEAIEIRRKKRQPKINEASRIWRKNKIATDTLFKLKKIISNRCRMAFNKRGYIDRSKTASMIGVSFDIAKLHIERQFKKGMTWDNHGQGKNCWHIDHIIPLATAKNEQELTLLCHYTNLQPLWSTENLKKNKKIPEVQIKLTI